MAARGYEFYLRGLKVSLTSERSAKPSEKKKRVIWARKEVVWLNNFSFQLVYVLQFSYFGNFNFWTFNRMRQCAIEQLNIACVFKKCRNFFRSFFFLISSWIFENVRSNKPSSARHFFGQNLLISKAHGREGLCTSLEFSLNVHKHF